MDYKTKSILTLLVIVIFMVVIAVFVNNLEGTITGTTVKPVCKCTEDNDCNDNNPCTEDICLYADDCLASLCINKKISGCE